MLQAEGVLIVIIIININYLLSPLFFDVVSIDSLVVTKFAPNL